MNIVLIIVYMSNIPKVMPPVNFYGKNNTHNDHNNTIRASFQLQNTIFLHKWNSRGSFTLKYLLVVSIETKCNKISNLFGLSIKGYGSII